LRIRIPEGRLTGPVRFFEISNIFYKRHGTKAGYLKIRRWLDLSQFGYWFEVGKILVLPHYRGLKPQPLSTFLTKAQNSRKIAYKNCEKPLL
jgi:hypothetical protein